MKRISHIFLNGGQQSELTANAKSIVSSSLAHFSDYEHYLYNDQTGRELLQTHFDRDAVEAYDNLVPYSYKADLLKYCILFKHGGWYFDLGVKVVQRLEIAGTSPIELLAFRDHQNNAVSSWACSCGVIWGRKHNSVFEECIKMIVGNVKKNFYGVNKLAPTGPLVFGASIAKKNEETIICFGDHLELTPGKRETNRAFVLADGTIIAFGKTRSVEESNGLGFPSEGNYKRLWEQRRIYREPRNEPIPGNARSETIQPRMPAGNQVV